jgi:hypothetical protein
MLTGLYVFVLLGIAASINLPSNKGWFKGSSRNDYQLKPVDCGNNNSTFVNNILTLFMPATYSVIFDDDDDVKHDEPKEFYVRQVPGDGSCLFHAVATCIKFVASNDNIKLYNNLIFDNNMKRISFSLRKIAVDVLNNTKNITLYMENNETIYNKELLVQVADYYNSTTDDYCTQMLKKTTWGGGPEIVAISNYIKRPIYVYELCSKHKNNGNFKFKICAKFGCPIFDKKNPLYILCADGRFPNIKLGEEKSTGDHFLALFPVEKIQKCLDGGEVGYADSDQVIEEIIDKHTK